MKPFTYSTQKQNGVSTAPRGESIRSDLFTSRRTNQENAPLTISAYVSHVFGLTRAEAAFARLLITGKSVAECASELGVSIHTARSHLKKAMAKTGTNRQGALIGLLLRRSAGVGDVPSQTHG